MKYSLLERAMLFCSRAAQRYPWPILIVSGVFFLLSLALAARFLEFQTSREDLISAKDELHDIQHRFLAEFPAADDVVVMVRGGTSSDREAYVNTLAGFLLRHPNRFQGVFPRVELPFLTSRALLFLPEEQLEELVEAVEQAQPFLTALSSKEGLSSLLSDFNNQVPGSDRDNLISMLPFLGDIFHELRRQVETRGRADYQSPWGGLLFGDSNPEFAKRTQDGLQETTFYHTTSGGSVHLLLLRFVERDAESIALLRKTVDLAQMAHRNLEVGITGEPLLEYDEMVSSEADSNQSGMLSMVLVAILFGIAFRQIARPAAIIGSFTLGAGWTVGFTTLAIGHLNLLTVSFFTILVGSGVDFGIHILMRYEEEFAKRGDSKFALDEALVGTGSDIAVSAFATASAFWAVGFTDFKGVSELGIIAGFGILLCLIATVLPLPAIVCLLDRKREPNLGRLIASSSRILMARGEAALLRRAPWTLLLTVLVLIWAWPNIGSVGFDDNLLRLQDQRLESVQTELQLIREGGNTVLFAVSLADSLEQAREKKKAFEALPTVSHVDTVSDLFPEVTPRKSAAISRLKEVLIPVDIPSPEAVTDTATGGKGLRELGDGFLGLKTMYDLQRDRLLSHESETVRQSSEKFELEMNKLFEELSSIGPGPIEDGVTNFQSHFFNNLKTMVEFLKKQESHPVMGLEDLPDNLKLRSIGRTGKLVLRIYPKENIWEREALDAFVKEVRGLDDTTVGAPVMIWHHTKILKGAFQEAGVSAMVAIGAILFLYFRSFTWTLLATVPLALGVLFMLFAMSVFGVSFNLANFMGLPLLLGIGMDYGIHVLHRAQEEGRVNMFDHATGPATSLSAMTTVAGFGTLALGGHQGIASLGFLLTTGVIGILLSALLVVPAILQIWSPFEKHPKPVEEAESDYREELSA